MQESIALFHTAESSQLGRVSAARRRRQEFIDRRTLMLVRAIAGPRACRKRKLLFTRWRMSSTINGIAVGHPRAFRRLHTEGNYAVFVKTQGPCLPDLCVIARLVKTASDFQPASAIESFNSEASAIEALKRLSQDPVGPKPPSKVCDLGAQRRNSNRKRKGEIEADQLELDL